MRPRIAITVALEDRDGTRRLHLPLAYADAVRAAGGEPVLLPPTGEDAEAPPLGRLADGLLLAGGGDLDSTAWGEPLHPAARLVDPRRQRADLDFLAAAEALRMPVLGLCLGMQEMAVRRGGSIIQHLPDEPGRRIDHGRAGRPRVPHEVHVVAGTLLARLTSAAAIEVNSRHHQAVRRAGRGMCISGRAPDGVIEAIEDAAPGRFLLGVQWHPEDLMDRPAHAALFEGLCGAAAAWRAA